MNMTRKHITAWLLTALALLLIASAPCWAGPIEKHPKFADIQTTVDTLIDRIGDQQAVYFAIHKQYFQGLTIPDKEVLEMDGMTYEKIDEGLTPHDQQESWKDFDSTVFFKDATLPCHITVDVYKTPAKGCGWILTADLYYEDNHWMFVHDEGPGGANPHPKDEWFIWNYVPESTGKLND